MAGLRCGARGLESGRAGAAQVIHREGRHDREGIVTHVPPLHDVAIEEVLQILQRQSEEAHGNDQADFLAAAAGKEQQQERGAPKGEEMEASMMGQNRPRSGRLQGADDQKQQPRIGNAADDPCAIQCVADD